MKFSSNHEACITLNVGCGKEKQYLFFLISFVLGNVGKF
jgi:hypothetical protein